MSGRRDRQPQRGDRKQTRLGAAAGADRAAGPPALRLAQAMLRRGEYDAALRQFEQAVRQHPTHLQVLLQAAHALGRRYRTDRAGSLLEKAVRLAPRQPEVQFLVGEAYRSLGRLAEAQAAFERACLLVDLFPDAQVELAFIYERCHRLPEALELIRCVLVAQPQRTKAILLKARILRRQSQHTQAESLLQQILQLEPDRSPRRAEALGDLAQLYDELQQYDAAWNAILESKQILLQHDAKAWTAAQIVFGRFGQLAREVTGSQLQEWTRPVTSDSSRVAMLTGFPRSGTTLLEQMLESHADVISSEEQDVLSAEIFPNLSPVRSHAIPVAQVLQELTMQRVQAARAEYLRDIEATLGEPVGSRLLLDKNPAMTLMIPVVLRLFPEMKLLVALRDPRDVIVSCFLRYLPLNPVSVCYLTLDRLVDRYSLDMNAWVRYRELLRDGWHEVRYERLVAQTQTEARRVLEFLGVAWDDSVLDHRRHVLRNPVQSPTYEDVAKPIYASAIGRWQHYEKYLEPILPRLESVLTSLEYA